MFVVQATKRTILINQINKRHFYSFGIETLIDKP